jgi:hypothetical protein
MREKGSDWQGYVQNVRGFTRDLYYTIDAARRDLGYTPQVTLGEGLSRVCSGPAAREQHEAGNDRE